LSFKPPLSTERWFSFIRNQNEFNDLAGAGAGFSPGRVGPMLYPRAWRRMIATMSQLPDNILRRFGGGLVVAGIVIYYMLRKTIG
jgi:uncharacterized protein YjeT (DUF2065 family)